MDNQQWLNRIVGEGAEAPDQLLANPYNARIHPQFQQDALAGVLDSVGWVDRVIVNRLTGHIVDGHLRVMLAMKRDEALVPVQYVELTEDEEKLVLATFDPITALAVYDREVLDTLLREVNSAAPSIQQMLSELAVSHGIVDGFDPNAEWIGMPEFENTPRAYRTLYIHFRSESDFDAFCQLIKQTISDGIKSIWYPERVQLDSEILRFEDE